MLALLLSVSSIDPNLELDGEKVTEHAKFFTIAYHSKRKTSEEDANLSVSIERIQNWDRIIGCLS